MVMRQCIVIADRARARLFSVEEEKETPFVEGRRRLREDRDLVSPEGKLTDEELFRDRRSGRRSRSSVGGGGYGTDDGKDRQRDESARRFAKEISAAASELVRTKKAKALVLVASPKFLGIVRSEVRKAIPKGVELTELPEDLSWHALGQLEKVLTRHGVFDSPEPVVEYRARTPSRNAKKRPRHAKKRR